MTNDINIEHLQQWIGKTHLHTDTVSSVPVTALRATLDYPEKSIQPGYSLPKLWHWLYFLPMDRQSDIDASGHAKLGGFMPPVPLPRRMWAGSQLAFNHPIKVGDTIERRSTINNVTHKIGKSGDLVFVQVMHQINCTTQADQLGQTFQSVYGDDSNQVHKHSSISDNTQAITEYHDIVYRAASQTKTPPPPSPKAAPSLADWERTVHTNDVLLFRYSALTFNGHRIHYDRRYVTEVEGYPGLIVHGPLIATLLLDALQKELPDVVVTHYDFKAIKPIFDTHPFYVCGAVATEQDAGSSSNSGSTSVHLWAKDHIGDIAMDAVAIVQKAKA